MPSWTNAADVRKYLGSNASADDALLQQLADACAQAIETYTNRVFELTTYTDVQDGNGKDALMLYNYPVTAVASVSVTGQGIPPLANNDFTSTGFMFDADSVYLQGRFFDKGRRNISISYTAGFAAIPADLVQACIETTALKYKQRDSVGFNSKTLAGETISFVTTDFPRSVLTLLSNYKRVVPTP